MENENKAKTVTDFEKEWRTLPLTDDFMFTKVFSDEVLCKGLIELLLGVKVKKLAVPPEYQKVQKTSKLCHTDVAREQRENILFCRLKGR